MLFLLLLLAACQSPATDAGTAAVRFNGQVTRGQEYEHAIGPELAFRLVAGESAGDEAAEWTIWVGDPRRPDEDFSALVTPPLRGMNARVIRGWHFRNEENTGPNDGSVPAPQEVRRFRFVTDREDYALAEEALPCLLWSYECSEAEIEAAEDQYGALPVQTGVLTITGMTLSPPARGERAQIERMAFEVEIQRPD